MKVLEAPRKKSFSSKMGLKKKRACLKCGRQFHSKGPYNRICDKCGLMNERVAASTKALSQQDSNSDIENSAGFYAHSL